MTGSISKSQVNQLSSGITQALTKLDANVVAQVWAEQLPVLGNNLQEAAAGGAAALHQTKALGDAIKNGIDALLTSGAASYTEAQVEAAVNAALASKGFTGTGLDADFSNAGDLKVNFTSQRSGDNVNADSELDFGLANLRLEAKVATQTSVGAAFKLAAGIDAVGFYVQTGGEPAIAIDTKTTLPGLNSVLEFGGLGFQATDSAKDSSEFAGKFSMTLKDGNHDGKLRAAELGGDLLDATLDGSADINLDVSLALKDFSFLPSFKTEFNLDWNFDDAAVDPLDDNSEFGFMPKVAFNNSNVNLGSFFDGIAGKVLRQIGEVTAPMQPVIDFITQPIPVLSDLGSDKVTLLDFMGDSPEENAAIQGLVDIIELANSLAGFADAGTVGIDLGSVSLSGDIRVDSGLDLGMTILRDPGELGNQNADLGEFIEAVEGIGGGGLSFPNFQDLTSIGRILLGQDVDIFEYQTEFGFDYEYKQFFPIWGPIGVNVGGTFGVHALFDFGFDLKGARDYFESGMTDPTDIFDGFYVRAVDDSGNVVTGFEIEAGVIVGPEVNIGIANAGGEGDLTANVKFGLSEALADSFGKIRGNKLISTPIDELFDPSGTLTSGMRLYLELGVSPFSVEFSVDSPRVTLLNFDGDKGNGPVLASEIEEGVWVLNVGDRSAERKQGTLEDIAEAMTVDINTFFIHVEGFGTSTDISDATKIIGNGGGRSDELVVGEILQIAAELTGGKGRDILTGGKLADKLQGDEGPDVLTGYGSEDNLTGGLGSDRLIGGAGGDIIDGGDGLDTASYATASAGMTIDLRINLFTGDGVGDTLISIERYEGTDHNDTIHGDDTLNRSLNGLDGDDTINGHGDADQLLGGKGNDGLIGEAGDDLLSGGEGADNLDGGAGTDTANYMQSKTPVTVSLKTGLGAGGDAQGDVLTGIEILIGSGLPFGDLTDRYVLLNGKPITKNTGDDLEGSEGDNIISGLGGADLLKGGGGNDIIYGDSEQATSSSQTMVDFDVDTIQGGSGDDKLYGQHGHDDLDGGNGVDLMEGGEGDDHLRTLDLTSIDLLDGGTGYNRLTADYSDQKVAIKWIGGEYNDYLFSNGESERNFQTLGELRTGSKRDRILLDNKMDDGYGNTLITNGGKDRVESGKGRDTIDGGAGKDLLFGGANSDFISGGSGDDFINGGSNDVKLTIGGFAEVVGYSGFKEKFSGGAGVDTITFEDLKHSIVLSSTGKAVPLGVTVDLSANTTGRAAAGIFISGFVNIIGTNAADDLTGDDQDNVFQPLRGGGAYSGLTFGPDRIDGKGGTDTLIINFSNADLANSAGVLTTFNSLQRLSSDGTTTVDSYTYSNMERLHITGASKDDKIYTWVAAPGDDYLNGMSGNDQLGGGGGSDTLFGDDGNDVIYGQGTSSSDYSGVAGGKDVFEGGAGDDIIEDFAINHDAIGPLLGADALFKLDGGDGFDILSVDFSNQGAAIEWDSRTPTNFKFADGSYARNFEQLRNFATGAGNDKITQLGRVDSRFFGGAGDDIINAGLGKDVVNGGDGLDFLIVDFSVLDTPDLGGVTGGGGSGAFLRKKISDFTTVDSVTLYNIEAVKVTGTVNGDNFQGTFGSDTLFGGGGNDVIDGQVGGEDFIDGGDGNDTLTGSNGAFSTTGNDVLIGGAGDDKLIGLFGNDSLSGGGGNDVLRGMTGVDSLIGGTGSDTADFSDTSSVVVVTLNSSGTVVANVGGIASDSLTGIENVTGGFGGDTLTGDTGNNALAGGDGFDILEGKAGADTFVFARHNGGADTIVDFNSKDDIISVSASGFGGGLVAGKAVTLITTTDFASASGVNELFVYDTAGADAGLYFDVNGGSAADAVLFAKLTGNPSVNASDIAVF